MANALPKNSPKNARKVSAKHFLKKKGHRLAKIRYFCPENTSCFVENDTAMKTNINLKPYNSFGFSAIAKSFVEIDDTRELQALIGGGELRGKRVLVVGGGNNILLTGDTFDGVVVAMRNKGMARITDDGDNVVYRVQAGEDWPDFVRLMVSQGLHGVENLAAIPGTVGAAPIQNIGAYGTELKDSFVRCETIHLETGEQRIFENKECAFGYRSSIFKTALRNQYVITSVDFALAKSGELRLDYGNITAYLEKNGIARPTLQQLHDTICAIRSAKLPDPKDLGNAGSFFKNPVIGKEQFEDLQKDWPDMPHYDEPNGMVKVPAAWLIEKTGWRGRREGNVGVYEKQALIIVHYGNGKGCDIVALANKIQESVNDKFGIAISPEVNFV